MRRVAWTLTLWALIWCVGLFLFRHPQWKQAVFLPTFVGLIFGCIALVGGKMIFVALVRRKWTAAALWLSTGAGIVLLTAGSDIVKTIAVGHGLRIGITVVLMMGLMPLLGVLYRLRAKASGVASAR